MGLIAKRADSGAVHLPLRLTAGDSAKAQFHALGDVDDPFGRAGHGGAHSSAYELAAAG
jgi:hypothetical protein